MLRPISEPISAAASQPSDATGHSVVDPEDHLPRDSADHSAVCAPQELAVSVCLPIDLRTAVFTLNRLHYSFD